MKLATKLTTLFTIALFSLALASKEEAIIGVLLLPLIYWYASLERPATGEPTFGKLPHAGLGWYDRSVFLASSFWRQHILRFAHS